MCMICIYAHTGVINIVRFRGCSRSPEGMADFSTSLFVFFEAPKGFKCVWMYDCYQAGKKEYGPVEHPSASWQ